MTGPAKGTIAASTAVLLCALYFAQGLPYGFFTQALPVVLRESGLSLTQISATGVLFAPWALKFLWAPYVDRYGTRRRWLLTLQLAAAALALVMASLDLSGSLRWLLVGIAVMNLISATQDVATDGLAVRLLGYRGKGIGNGIQVGAYRIGMIVGGGGLLWLLTLSGWRGLFIVMSGLILLCTLPVWWLREPTPTAHPAPNARAAQTTEPAPTAAEAPGLARMAAGWWTRLRRPGMAVFILLIGAYKFGDSMGSALVGPFMVDSGLTVAQIALIKGALSSAAALGGAALGGWLAYRLGRRNALLLTGVAQTISLALYLFASLGIGGFALIVTASLAEHVLGGAATVALFTLMMDASERDHAGSDYTLLACAIVLVQGVAGITGGVIGDLFGYPTMFATSFVLSGLGCAALVIALGRGVGPAGVREVIDRRRQRA
ncbi:MFS transporter [Millisia brevis]|uniref:MFS transporter n=1 Tax=Millisia brevis TaxID=264148 RepID=UPI00082CC382|nr:MFS transporter [Millisia brevis]